MTPYLIIGLAFLVLLFVWSPYKAWRHNRELRKMDPIDRHFYAIDQWYGRVDD